MCVRLSTSDCLAWLIGFTIQYFLDNFMPKSVKNDDRLLYTVQMNESSESF